MSLKNEFAKFGDASERERKLDVLTYQIEEIEKADVKDGEEEELLAQRKRIRNMEKLFPHCRTQSAYSTVMTRQA